MSLSLSFHDLNVSRRTNPFFRKITKLTKAAVADTLATITPIMAPRDNDCLGIAPVIGGPVVGVTADEVEGVAIPVKVEGVPIPIDVGDANKVDVDVDDVKNVAL